MCSILQPTPGTGEWRWDGISGQWVKVTGTSTGNAPIGTGGTLPGSRENILNIGGTDAASEWRWNRATGNSKIYSLLKPYYVTTQNVLTLKATKRGF